MIFVFPSRINRTAQLAVSPIHRRYLWHKTIHLSFRAYLVSCRGMYAYPLKNSRFFALALLVAILAISVHAVFVPVSADGLTSSEVNHKDASFHHHDHQVPDSSSCSSASPNFIPGPHQNRDKEISKTSLFLLADSCFLGIELNNTLILHILGLNRQNVALDLPLDLKTTFLN